MNKPITLGINNIKQVNGLYCLNDLHKASDGAGKGKPQGTYVCRELDFGGNSCTY